MNPFTPVELFGKCLGHVTVKYELVVLVVRESFQGDIIAGWLL